MAQKLVDLGCPQDKVRIWRLGVDVERIEFAVRSAGERTRLLICAGFKEKKGIPYALRALAAALAQKSFPYALTLIGDGEDRRLIEALVDELGLRPYSTFTGMMPYEQVLAELLRHDILLQTSVTAQNGDGEGGVGEGDAGKGDQGEGLSLGPAGVVEPCCSLPLGRAADAQTPGNLLHRLNWSAPRVRKSHHLAPVHQGCDRSQWASDDSVPMHRSGAAGSRAAQ